MTTTRERTGAPADGARPGRAPFEGAPTEAPDETDWSEALRRDGASGPVAAELRAYLRRGLARALHGRVSEADLDDFTQDGLLRVLESLHTFRGESRLSTWAMAVAIRAAFGTLRKRRRREALAEDLAEGFLENLPDDGDRNADPGVRAAERALLGRLRDAIETELTPRQRAAILGELRGVPTEELAAQLGINRNAFYKLHHDARKKLRAALPELVVE